jgi:hypothetical protein
MEPMQSQTTDINALPHRWRNLLPLTGFTCHQVHSVCAVAQQELTPRPGRPRSLPLPVRVLPVLIHLRTNLTTRALPRCFTPANPPWTAPSASWCRYWPSTASRPRQQCPSVDHRRHPDPRPRPTDYRHQQELPAQHQHPNHHLRAPAARGDRRAVFVGPETATTSSSPVQQSHTCSPASARSSVTAAPAASTRSPHQHQTSPAGSSATITTAHTGASPPPSSMSSPESRIGRSFDNAADEATPTTTALQIVAGHWNPKASNQLRVNS